MKFNIKKLMKWKYLVFTFFIGLSVFFLFQYVANQWLSVKEIQIQAQEDVYWEDSIAEIQSKLQSKFQPFIGKRIWDISLNDLKNILQLENSRIGSFQIIRLLPNRFLVRLQPIKPLLIFLDANGKIYPLGMDGELLHSLPVTQIPDAPILRGSVFSQELLLRQLALEFMQLLPEQGDFSRQTISEVSYSHREKSLFFRLSKNGRTIKVNRNPKQLRIKRIESVLHYLDQQSIQWYVMDARFLQKIVVSTHQSI